MKKNLFILIILALFFLGFSPQALAASIFISPLPEVSIGQSFFVDINATSDGELINSVDIVLDYSEELLNFAGYQDESGVVKLWINSPVAKDGKVYMSGIIPGGVSGFYDPKKEGLSAIPLVRLRFTAKASGLADFSFGETKILKSDGKGTELAHQRKNSQVKIKNIDTQNPNVGAVFVDKKNPEPFSITLVESSIFSRTPQMIIFQALDLDSGISSYQIKIGAGGWKDAKSPEPISKSIFSRSITVRAFDFYGNFQDASFYVKGVLSPKLLLLIFALFLSCILGYKLLKYRA